MSDLIDRARSWISQDPDPQTRAELEAVVESGDTAELEERMNTELEFGTAGIRGKVGAGPGRMNRAVVIRTTYGLARFLESNAGADELGRVVVGFDARPSSRQFAEDTTGVLAAAGIPVLFFPGYAPTPIVAYAAKHLRAVAAVVVTASHNPPADNGYKVYGPQASQIVSPADVTIQGAIDEAPGANEIARVEAPFTNGSDLIARVPDDILDCYWEEVATARSRTSGSDLDIVYTPIHGVGKETVFEVMHRAGHHGIVAVPEQSEPDGTFPTVEFPNPEEPGALDLALDLAERRQADLVIANDPDADRFAAVIPKAGEWRPLSGNEVGILLGDYILRHDRDAKSAIVASSIVSSPMLASVAQAYGATHTQTLTGFKWIVKAGLAMEKETGGRFVYAYEEALGYTVGSTVRDKDGISAALLFIDLVADLRDEGKTVMDRLHGLWKRHGLWVSEQTSLVRAGPEGAEAMGRAITRLASNPPEVVDGLSVTRVLDYRENADMRPPWLGAQDLIELKLGELGRILVRPSGTEPKLKIYVDLCEKDPGSDPDATFRSVLQRAADLGEDLAGSLGI